MAQRLLDGRAFGHVGSFFEFEPASGSFEANPPFEPVLMMAMAERMEKLLSTAEAAGAPLSFSVVVPGWTETESWR